MDRLFEYVRLFREEGEASFAKKFKVPVLLATDPAAQAPRGFSHGEAMARTRELPLKGRAGIDANATTVIPLVKSDRTTGAAISVGRGLMNDVHLNHESISKTQA